MSAAAGGALNNLKWLLKNGFSMEDTRIFGAAIGSGSLDVFKWLKRNKCPLDKGTMYSTLENCSIEALEWLIEQDIEIYSTTEVFMGAARSGRLDQMKMMLKKNYSIEDPRIFEAAAEI